MVSSRSLMRASRNSFWCLSDIGSFIENVECFTTIASHSPFATCAKNARRFSGFTSASDIFRMFAFGNASTNSFVNCSSMWFGTTYIGFLKSPRCRPRTPIDCISSVLPAPTQCARHSEPLPSTPRAITADWYSRPFFGLFGSPPSKSFPSVASLIPAERNGRTLFGSLISTMSVMTEL